MSEPFATKILSFTPISPGFQVSVRHTEWLPDTPQKTTDRHEFPVIGWATVQADGSERTFVEAVFLWEGDPISTSDYRRTWSNLKPDPGEPKQTVGVKVIPPKEDR